MIETSPSSETPQSTDQLLVKGLRLYGALLVFTLLFVGPAAAGKDKSFLCNVGIFKNSINILIQGLFAAFSPIALISVLGDRVISSLPIGKKRKKKFKQWRGEALVSTGILYIGLPVGVTYAKQAGFPLASCINFIPW